MPYIAIVENVQKNYVDPGLPVDNGECVKLVQAASGAPVTSHWKRGAKVKGNLKLLRGTAIATFTAEGKYPNRKDGSSHAAIYLAQDKSGLQVIDQWAGRPPAPRTIRFRNGEAKPVNDGDQYYVVD